MKGNGRSITAGPFIDEAPQGLSQISNEAVMDCDYCGRAMNFETYSTHQCDGLNGENPWQEKLKNANWKIPGKGSLKGSMSAAGHVRTIEQVEESARRAFIHSLLISFAVLAAGIAAGLVWLIFSGR